MLVQQCSLSAKPFTILWSTGDTTENITVSPTTSTTFYITVSDGITTCVDSVRINISTIETALIVLDLPQDCSIGGTIRLQAGLVGTYQWLKDGIAIPGAVSQLYTATQTGVYRVAPSNAQGCRSSTVSWCG